MILLPFSEMESQAEKMYQRFLLKFEQLIALSKRGTQKKLAEHVGTGNPYINDILRGRKKASTEMQEKILSFFDLRLEDVVLPAHEQPSAATTTLPPSPARIVYAESRPGDYRNLIEKVKTVLASNTPYRTALESNIEAFHLAVVTEARLDRMEQQLNRIISGDPVIKEPPPEKVVNRPGD